MYIKGYCTKYSILGKAIQLNYKRKCLTFTSNPCPEIYSSHEAFKCKFFIFCSPEPNESYIVSFQHPNEPLLTDKRHQKNFEIFHCRYFFFRIFLAHLSWKLKWAFLITCRPASVCPSVRPSVRPSVCLSVCKLFTFSSSSSEPLGQFQPNLAQSILGWRGFKFVQMKGPALFQGEIITK